MSAGLAGLAWLAAGAGVAMRAIEWLWVGWIPKGYITLFAGETGAGKSTVIGDITARVTTGKPWPGEYECRDAWRKPERVLWLGSEDSIEEMTVPRLMACGAIRALQRRVKRMETARKPRPSPIVVMFGSFDNFVAVMFQPAWDNGTMEQGDILDLVDILRGWETDGTWERAHAR